jgi:hypothetical protein
VVLPQHGAAPAKAARFGLEYHHDATETNWKRLRATKAL